MHVARSFYVLTTYQYFRSGDTKIGLAILQREAILTIVRDWVVAICE